MQPGCWAVLRLLSNRRMIWWERSGSKQPIPWTAASTSATRSLHAALTSDGLWKPSCTFNDHNLAQDLPACASLYQLFESTISRHPAQFRWSRRLILVSARSIGPTTWTPERAKEDAFLIQILKPAPERARGSQPVTIPHANEEVTLNLCFLKSSLYLHINHSQGISVACKRHFFIVSFFPCVSVFPASEGEISASTASIWAST